MSITDCALPAEIAEQYQRLANADAVPGPTLPGHIPRPGLVRRLEAALNKQLVLVTAPAGYGKTRLLGELRSALNGGERICVRLAPSGGDAAHFAAALGDARAQIGPGGEPSDRFGDTPARDIVIFIDDNDAAQSEEIGGLVKNFLRDASDHVRVIFAGRAEPACGAAKMRLDGRLAEFTTGDLAFGDAETAAIFINEGLAPAAAERLAAKTMGWPAAMGLARLWLAGDGAGDINGEMNAGMNASINANINERAAQFSGGLAIAAGYIAQEALGDLDAAALDFLTRMAPFASFDAGLADAALAQRESAAMLRRLDRRGGLIFPAHDSSGHDGFGRWRHHPLLAEYFRDRLFETVAAEEIAASRKRAAAWLLGAGDAAAALEHAAEAGDGAGVKAVLQHSSFGFIAISADRGRFRRLMTGLEEFAPKHRRLPPGRALAHIVGGRADAAREMLSELSDTPAPYAAADARLITALYHLHADTPKDDKEDADAAIAALEALRGDGAMDHPVYGGVLHDVLGGFYLRAGRVARAEEALERAAGSFRRGHAHGAVIRTHIERAMIAMMKADIAGARAFHDEARQACRQYAPGNAALSAIIDICAAACDYERGGGRCAPEPVAGARRALIADGDYRVALLTDAFRVEANLAFSRRGPGDARAVLDRGAAFARERGFARLAKALMAQKLHLAATEGDIKAAKNFKADLDRAFGAINRGGEWGFGWREDALRVFAEVRFEIASGRGDVALIMLNAFDKGFTQKDLQWFAHKSGALRALALAARGEAADAAALTRALVEKGDASGARAFLLEEGAAAQALLNEAARRFSKTKKASAFNAALMTWLIAAPDFLPPDRRRAAPVLSARQLRILALLARGLDRNAIAEAAQTTTHNVQYHLKTMFTAFGVSSSTGLVAEATRLGMVEDVTHS